jgi:hypothetical protein
MVNFKFGTKNMMNLSSTNIRNTPTVKTKMNLFKNLTVGKLLTSLVIVFILTNFIIVSVINGIPYKQHYENASFWTQITGISFIILIFLLFVTLIVFIIENWNKKLFK